MPKRPISVRSLELKWCIWLPRRQRFLSRDGSVNDRLPPMPFESYNEAHEYRLRHLLEHADPTMRATRLTHRRIPKQEPLAPGSW